MARRAVRNLDLYAMHGHFRRRSSEEFPYDRFFRSFQNLSADRRVFEYKGRVVAFPVVRNFGRGLLLHAVEGPIGVRPLILDMQRGTARTEELEDTEVVTETTHLLVYAERRRVVIEYNRRGAKSIQLGLALEHIANAHLRDFSDIDFGFSPIVSEKFAEEIDALDRIRAVEMTVTRPNASWTDHYTELSALLEASNGEKADVGVKAPRGESLSKGRGIVALIKKLAGDREPYLVGAKVHGRSDLDGPEVVIPLERHVVREKASVAMTESGQVDSQELGGKMVAMLDEQNPQNAA